MRALVIDTAGPVVGVACLAGGRLAARSARVERAVDAVLLGWVDEVVADLGLTLAQLDGVGVAAGPGTFTGLRVGLATASGLAFALGLPLWSADSLASRAARVAAVGPVVAMLDARKGRVYAAWYEAGACVRPSADLPPDDALRDAPPGFVATGEGAVVYASRVVAAGGVVAEGVGACAVGELAVACASALAAGQGARALDVRPVYLRDADVRLPRS